GRHQGRGTVGPADLGKVGLVVAPDQGRNRLAVGQEDQQLGAGPFGDLEELADLFNRTLVRRVDPFKGRRGGFGDVRPGAGADLGALDVGCIAALRALDHRVFARVGGDHELVGAVAANRPALGLDDDVGQAAAVEHPAVSLIHGVVAFAELGDVGVEAV